MTKKLFHTLLVTFFAFATSSLIAQEIQIQGKPNPSLINPLPSLSDIDDDDGQPINNSPKSSNGTDFGNVNRGESNTHEFRIRNRDNNTSLRITSVDFPVGGQFVVSGLPAVPFTIPAGEDNDFTITYTPTIFDTRVIRVTFGNNDPNEGQTTFRLQGTGVGPDMKIFETSPTVEIPDFEETDFGSILAASSATVVRTFLIRNDGNRLLSLSNPTVGIRLIEEGEFITGGTGFDFQGVLGVGGISPGEERTFTMTFDPEFPGSFRSLFRVGTNDRRPGRDNQDMIVVGVATGIPDISIAGTTNGSPDPVIFVDTNVGEETVRDSSIRNLGDVDLLFNTPELRGRDADQFEIRSLADDGRISPDGSINFTIRFRPTSPGLKTATFSIRSNDPNEDPYSFVVQGRGNGPQILIVGGSSATTVADGSTIAGGPNGTMFPERPVASGMAGRTYNIRNTGNAPLRIESAVVTGLDPGAFTILRPDTGAGSPEIIPGGEVILGIVFDPTEVGLQEAVIDLQTNVVGPTEHYTFAVSGIGRNAGNEPAIEVRHGIRGGFLISDGDATPSSIDGTDFGQLASSATPVVRTFQVRNSGEATLDISSVELLQFGSGFTVSGGTGTVSPGLSRSFTVSFSPTSGAGLKTAIVIIRSNAPEIPTYDFTVQGTILSPGDPDITVRGGSNPSIVIKTTDDTPTIEEGTDFGAISSVDAPLTHRFFLDNNGETDLRVSGINLVQLVPVPGFSLTGQETVIEAGETGEIAITLDPLSALGRKKAQVQINTNDPDTPIYVFDIIGRITFGVPEPNILVSGGTGLVAIASGDVIPDLTDGTDFGSFTPTSLTTTRAFQIANTGTGMLSTNMVTLGTSGAGFTVSSMPEFLAGGETATFTVAFDPAAAGPGTHGALVQVLSDDPDTFNYFFSLSAVVSSQGSLPMIPGVEQDGDDLVITIETPPGKTVRIATSTDLISWAPLAGQTGLSSSTIRLSDVIGQGGSAPARFYRIEEEP